LLCGEQFFLQILCGKHSSSRNFPARIFNERSLSIWEGLPLCARVKFPALKQSVMSMRQYHSGAERFAAAAVAGCEAAAARAR
jgi:hypothetical protein